jgi:ABC-type nitrate/sulfonate/bicarbonate transport system substrate-binding protein
MMKLVALVLLLAACNTPPPAAPPTLNPATSQPPTAAPTAAPAANGQLTEIRIGITGNTADAPLFIAQDRGYFKEQGLKLAYTRVQSANDVVAPLGAGQLEVGGGAISAGLFNAIARGIDVRIVADKGQHSGSPVNGFTSAVVLTIPKQDADVYKTLADVKGKTISLASTGSGNEIMLDRGLQSVGLTNKDVNLKTLSFADGLAALSTHSVDLAIEIEPFVTQGVAKGILVPWLKSEELYAGQQGGVLVFGPSVAKLGADVGDRFMIAYVKGIRDYYDAFGVKHKDQDAIAAILANNTDVKDVSLYAKMGWDLIDPSGYVNAVAVADDLDWYAAHDYVQQKPDISRVIDNSYVEHALAVLGKYQP